MKKLQLARSLAGITFITVAVLCLLSCAYAIAPAMNAGQETVIRQIVSDVSPGRILACLQAMDFPRLADSVDAPVAEARLTALLEGAGYTVTKIQTGSADTWIKPMNTLVAEKIGSEPDLRPVFVMSHWDSAGPGHGMDDNASGVAATIEAATVLAGHEFRRTIRFLIFANEEKAIDGSMEYVNSLSDAQLPEFFVNFESIGYTKTGPDNFSAFLGQSAGDYIAAFAPDWASGSLATFSRAARAFVPELKFSAVSIPVDYKAEPLLWLVSQSDHLWFWNRKSPGLMITDGASQRNPNYHGNDTIETLDLPFLTAVARAGIAALCLQAGL